MEGGRGAVRVGCKWVAEGVKLLRLRKAIHNVNL